MQINQIISLIDLTNLSPNCTSDDINALCQKAQTPPGNVAAVCAYPKFVAQAKYLLKGTGINIATVANFPAGDTPLNETKKLIEQSLEDGADELDVVLPYKKFMKNETDYCLNFLKAIDAPKLKVILETGELKTVENITAASELAIAAGADFIKTSTGFSEVGATLEAAKAMLTTIKNHHKNSGKWIGFKASGGIKTSEQAYAYIELARNICGNAFIHPNTYRFGASGLLDNLLLSQ